MEIKEKHHIELHDMAKNESISTEEIVDRALAEFINNRLREKFGAFHGPDLNPNAEVRFTEGNEDNEEKGLWTCPSSDGKSARPDSPNPFLLRSLRSLRFLL